MGEVVEVTGLRVELAEPRLVDEGVGHCWFPDLVEFPGGKLLLTHSLGADALNLVSGQAVMVSGNHGRSWDATYDVAQGPAVKVGLPDGAIGGPSYYLYPDPPEQARRFVAHYMRIDDSGQRYLFEPWSVRVEGIPRDLGPMRHQGHWRGRRPT